MATPNIHCAGQVNLEYRKVHLICTEELNIVIYDWSVKAMKSWSHSIRHLEAPKMKGIGYTLEKERRGESGDLYRHIWYLESSPSLHTTRSLPPNSPRQSSLRQMVGPMKGLEIPARVLCYKHPSGPIVLPNGNVFENKLSDVWINLIYDLYPPPLSRPDLSKHRWV